MSYYEAECEFCGEDVGLPEDARAFFTFRNVTFYPEDGSKGFRITQPPGEDWQDPKDHPSISIHQECWTSYWDGSLSSRQFYS